MEKIFTKEQIEAMKPSMEQSTAYYRERNPLFHREMSYEEFCEEISLVESARVGTIVSEITVPIEVEDCEFEDIHVAEMEIDVLDPPFAVFYDWLDAADAMDGDIHAACAALNINGKKFATGNAKLHKEMRDLLEHKIANVFYVDSVSVVPQFRGYGIGKELVSNVENTIRSTFHAECGVIVLVASPVEIRRKNTDEYEKYSLKLFKFYEDCGFTRISEQAFVKLF